MSNNTQNTMIKLFNSTNGFATTMRETFKEKINLKWVSVQVNPYSINTVHEPSLPLQFTALAGMKEKKGIRLSSFPSETLFHQIHENNLGKTCQIIQSEVEFFKHLICFELLLVCLYETKQEWVSPILETFAPLTKEQEQVWKSVRLQSLF